MEGYDYAPTSQNPESTDVDVICARCGKKVDQICEELMFAGGAHKRCSCRKNKKRNTRPAGYISLKKIIELTGEEICLLKLCGMTHGMKIPNDPEGRFEVGFYGFKGAGSKMMWHRYCGKGADKTGWTHV